MVRTQNDDVDDLHHFVATLKGHHGIHEGVS